MQLLTADPGSGLTRSRRVPRTQPWLQLAHAPTERKIQHRHRSLHRGRRWTAESRRLEAWLHIGLQSIDAAMRPPFPVMMGAY